MEIDATWDIETEDWTTFVVGGLWDGQNFYHSQDENEFFDLLISRKGVFWAHNGGKFDVLWFYHMMKKRGIAPKQIVLQGSRVLVLRVADLVLRDSYALIPMGLNKAGGMVTDKKDDLPFGYQDIKRSMSEHQMRILIKYLKKDCTLLWDVLQYVRRYGKEHNLVLKSTVGSTAWNSANKELNLEPIDWKTGHWKFARSGYYGGRSEVFRVRSGRGNRYDRNSSYPAALVRTSLPTGERKLLGRSKAKTAYRRNYPGIFSATVFIGADTHYPPLPVKTPDLTGVQRLIFPVGRFTGTWTGLELHYAESVGAEILRIDSALVWKDKAKVLAPWCQRLWNLRHGAKTESEARWLKWVLNSLTGKLGERADKSVCVIPTEKNRPKGCNGHKNIHPEGTPCPSMKCCQHRHVNNPSCKRWMPIDPDLNLWERPIWFIPPNSYPHWAAYLTSEARISLHKKLLEVGSAGVYCDTDSVYCESGTEITEIGDELGEWKLEGLYQNWVSVAPKLYRYEFDDHMVVRGKGFPGLDAAGFERLLLGKAIEMPRRPHTFKSGLKADGGVWSKKIMEKRTRLIPGLVGSRGLNEDGTTRPLTLQQFVALLRKGKEK